MRVELQVAERKTMRIRVVLTVVGHPLCEQCSRPRLQRQTTGNTRPDVEKESWPSGKDARRTWRAAGATDAGERSEITPAGVRPDSRQIGSAVGGSGRGQQVRASIWASRNTGRRIRGPLRRESRRKKIQQGDYRDHAARHAGIIPVAPAAFHTHRRSQDHEILNRS